MEGNVSKMSCGNQLYDTAIDESSASFYYSFNNTNDKTLEADDNTTLEDSNIMGNTVRKQVLNTGSLATPIPKIIVSDFNVCSSTPNQEEKAMKKNLDFQSLGVSVLEQSINNDDELDQVQNPNNTAAYVESKATAEKIINDIKKIIISSVSIPLEIPQNKENADPIDNKETEEKLIRNNTNVKVVNKRASLLVRNGTGNFNNAGSTKNAPNLRKSVLKTNTLTRIISDPGSFKNKTMMDKNKPVPPSTNNSKIIPVKEFNLQKRKTLHVVVSKHNKNIEGKQLNKSTEEDTVINEEPEISEEPNIDQNLNKNDIKNTNITAANMTPPVRKLVSLKTTFNSSLNSSEIKRKKFRRTFNFSDKLAVDKNIRRSMLPIKKRQSIEESSDPKQTNSKNNPNHMKRKSIMPPSINNVVCSKTVKSKLDEANKKLQKNSDNTNKCQYCDKQFAFAKVLDNHLRLNCTKISGPERRKLTFLPPKGNNFQPSATSSKSSITSSSELVSGVSSSKKSGEEMGPPSSSKIKKKIPHSGLYRTPTKSIRCHECKKNFNTIVEYTQHVVDHES